jgi:hypothetical protein
MTVRKPRRNHYTVASVDLDDEILTQARRVGEFLNMAIRTNYPVEAVAKHRQFIRHNSTNPITYREFLRAASLAGFTVSVMDASQPRARRHNIARRRRSTGTLDVLHGLEDYASRLPSRRLSKTERMHIKNAIHDQTYNQPARYDDVLLYCRNLADAHVSARVFKELCNECNVSVVDRMVDRRTTKMLVARKYKSLSRWLAEDWDGESTPIKELFDAYKASGGGLRAQYTPFVSALRRDPLVRFSVPPGTKQMNVHRLPRNTSGSAGAANQDPDLDPASENEQPGSENNSCTTQTPTKTNPTARCEPSSRSSSSQPSSLPQR